MNHITPQSGIPNSLKRLPCRLINCFVRMVVTFATIK